jgi:hypothetical protein
VGIEQLDPSDYPALPVRKRKGTHFFVLFDFLIKVIFFCMFVYCLFVSVLFITFTQN